MNKFDHIVVTRNGFCLKKVLPFIGGCTQWVPFSTIKKYISDANHSGVLFEPRHNYHEKLDMVVIQPSGNIHSFDQDRLNLKTLKKINYHEKLSI